MLVSPALLARDGLLRTKIGMRRVVVRRWWGCKFQRMQFGKLRRANDSKLLRMAFEDSKINDRTCTVHLKTSVTTKLYG